MNKLKSLFIGMFPMFAMGVSGYGLYQFFSFPSEAGVVWLGAVLTSLPIMLFIGRVMMFKNMARTTPHFPLLTGIAIGGLVLAIYGFLQSAYTAKIPMALALMGFIFYLLYNFWYSSLGRGQHSALQIGQPLPDFNMTDTKGKLVSSHSFKGTPSIFIFFRGNWCPLCMAQIKEIAAQYREIAATGATVAFIAPQPEEKTQALAAKFDVPFTFLTDKDNHAAQKLGIEMKNGLPAGMEMFGYDKDTVYPTVIITDSNGDIIYTDLTNNYRIRPEPDAFINVLNTHARMV